MSFQLKLILSGCISLLTCVAVMPFVIKLAKYKEWVVFPRNDRWHKNPTALMGGIGIFVAFSVTILSIGGTLETNYWMIYAAAFVMFLVGWADDVWEVKPVIKLLAQIICSFVLIYNGYIFGGGVLEWAGIPLTFIWVIGITNAINLLDNMDGLAAGISAIVAIVSGVLAVSNNEYALAGFAFAIAGATIGFLFYNFKPALIFMGDSGSLFLGFSLSFLSIAVQGKMGSSSPVLMLLIPISLMAIPIMDTTLVSIKRLAAGRRIDQGGKDHTSHRLVALGLSEKKAVFTLYIISAIWGILCLLMSRVQVNNLFLCVLLLIIFSVAFSLLLSKVKVYNESPEKLSYLEKQGLKIDNNFTLRFFLLHKKLMIGLCTDILIIYCAFLFAIKATQVNLEYDYIVLATFICVKITVLYLSNLYYRMWRYMEVLEIAGYFIFTCIATIILVVILYFKYRTGAYTLYFFIFDFLLTFTGIIFSRLFYRSLSELINRNRSSEKKVMIYGAGDSGYLLIKEILQNHRHELKPIGWIDDDPSKYNQLLYGYKIYGGKKQLLTICEKFKPDMVLISTKAINKEAEDELRDLLAVHNIGIGRFSLTISFN
jgi:UDP-GlcNAc:undecaprenyl-phosphate GlcNAc-1-phosphate transferase